MKIKSDVARRLTAPGWSTKDRLIALIVQLMIERHFRIGSQANVHKDHTFGLTTLLGKHVVVRGDTAEFSYVGKKGVINQSKCRDQLVVSIIKNLKTQCPQVRRHLHIQKMMSRRQSMQLR